MSKYIKVRSFRRWKAEVLLWLSTLNNETLQNDDAKRIIIKLNNYINMLRRRDIQFLISRLTALKLLGVPVPPEIFPTREELEAWEVKNKDREPTKPPST
jgi:uncharacterized protein YpbB